MILIDSIQIIQKIVKSLQQILACAAHIIMTISTIEHSEQEQTIACSAKNLFNLYQTDWKEPFQKHKAVSL